MKSGIKISVLMSVYNPENRQIFFEAVQSIISQTFQDWEMILYDDGSEEPYIPLIREAAVLDRRFRYCRSEENRGLAQAMNICCGMAGGRYLARMDADDYSMPGRLQSMYEFLEDHPEYDWVGCNTELIRGDGIWARRVMPQAPDRKDFLRYSPYIHPSVVFRREVLTESGGYRPMRRGEDYELFMRLHASGRRGYNLQEFYFRYREDDNTYRHRKYRYQIEEVRIRKEGFQSLGILNIKTGRCVIKPLIVGLIPRGLLLHIKLRVRKEMHVERLTESKA
ncbi:MAG: glycosyltransferase [Lachnospiraceae bacterium]|nr:glycosyltransferase [Lachnospiraceae bacterium]